MKFRTACTAAVTAATAVSIAGTGLLAVPASAAEATTNTLIAAGSSWKYNDKGTDLGTAWRNASYADSAWTSGNSELGYGDGDEATRVSGGKSAYYFRKTFDAGSSLAGLQSVKLKAVVDDGAVAYLNGIEVWRFNVKANQTYATLATSYVAGDAEKTWQEVAIPNSALLPGANTLAIEVHNDALSSSDASFNISLTSTIAAPAVVAPAAPQGLTASASGTSAASVAWTAVAGAASYTVERQSAAGAFTAIASVTAPAYADSGLSAASTYSYRVTAVNSGGSSAPSATATVTTAAPAAPAAPTGLTAANSGTAINLAWNASAGATKYNVYRTIAGVQTLAGSPTATSFADTGRPASTAHSYVVKAVSAAGESAASNTAAITSSAVSTTPTSTKIMCKLDQGQVRESSGLAASLKYPGILWTHNDSGDTNRIFALDSTTCAVKATITLSGATAVDWEAIGVGKDAAGSPVIYVADVGDNGRSRKNVKLYQIPEPATLTTQTIAAKTYTVTYSNGAHDCESIMVDQSVNNGRVYLVTKEATGGIYALNAGFQTGTTAVATNVGIAVRGYLTDASMAPNGKSFILRSGNVGTLYTGAVPGTSSKSVKFPTQAQGEAITYNNDGTTVFIGSEGVDNLIQIPISTL